MLGLPLDEDEPSAISRQERRQRARAAAKASTQTDDDSGLNAIKAMRNLFLALRDDLDRSGMIDIVVSPEEGAQGPGVVLTLDKRYADETAVELLHTSSFTVIGKVTQLWASGDDVVLLYRRSVLSLLPALSGQVMAGVLAFLIGMAKAIGVIDVEQQVRDAIGSDLPTERDTDNAGPETGDRDLSAEGASDPEADESDDLDDIRVGHDIDALSPILSGRSDPAARTLRVTGESYR